MRKSYSLRRSSEPRERGGAGIAVLAPEVLSVMCNNYFISLSPTGNACCAIEFKFGKSLQ